MLYAEDVVLKKFFLLLYDLIFKNVNAISTWMCGLDKYTVETYYIFSDLLVVLILTDLAIFWILPCMLPVEKNSSGLL